MKSIFAKEYSLIDLGYCGENLARQIVFDLASWREAYGDGTAALIAQLPGQKVPYPCTTLRDGDTLVWQIQSADTSFAGKGKCELAYYVGEQLAKSAVFQTYIAESLAPTGEVPEPHRSWVDEVLAVGKDIHAAKETIENLSVSAEMGAEGSQADVSKTVTNGSIHLAFRIPRGPRGEKGDTGATGEKGEKGEIGYTPARGIDYFNEADMTYFKNHIDAQLDTKFGDMESALSNIMAIQEGLMGGDLA